MEHHEISIIYSVRLIQKGHQLSESSPSWERITTSLFSTDSAKATLKETGFLLKLFSII